MVAVPSVQHLSVASGFAAHFDLLVAVVGIAFGSLMAFRFFPRQPDNNSTRTSPPEPWYRRAMGWFGATVWCGVGVVWNLAIFNILVQSAIKGQSMNFIILIPFSLIGLFLLLTVFVSITLVLDFLFRLGDTAPSSPTGPEMGSAVAHSPAPIQASPQPTSQPMTQSNSRESESAFKKSPIIGTLALLSFINWFVFAGISIYLGGDAMGTIPSKDGFILASHGHHTTVSESVWVFSLFYSGSTLLLTPLIWLSFAARTMGGKFKTARKPMKIFLSVFLLVWCVGWFSSIGRSMYHSIQDWQQLKRQGEPVKMSPQKPSGAPVAQKGPTFVLCRSSWCWQLEDGRTDLSLKP